MDIPEFFFVLLGFPLLPKPALQVVPTRCTFPALQSFDHVRDIFGAHGRRKRAFLEHAPAFGRLGVGSCRSFHPLVDCSVVTVCVGVAARLTKASARAYFRGLCVPPLTLHLPCKMLPYLSCSWLVMWSDAATVWSSVLCVLAFYQHRNPFD